jgi:hypothetical protein
MEGYLEGPLNIALRVLSGVAALLMLWPHHNILIDSAGLVLFIGLFIYSRKTRTASLQTA